ncbi:MAG: isochorismatase family cysteine hydrolase [Paracoccaceae bacterium]
MDLRATAVLAIDLQEEYRAGAAYSVAGYDAVLSHAATVIAAARAADVRVVHAQAWAEPAAPSAYHLLNTTPGSFARSGAAHTAGAALCAEVEPEPQDTVIRKAWPSAFAGTGLSGKLQAGGVSNLVVFGVWTDSCVRATVFDAVYAGFHVWLVKDACGSGTDAMHRTAVLDMANRLYGGGVLDARRAVAGLRGEPLCAWRCTRPVEFLYSVETVTTFYDAL